MTRPQHYRTKAAECREFAAIMTSPEARGSYDAMARRWEHLAAELERHDARMWEAPSAHHR